MAERRRADMFTEDGNPSDDDPREPRPLGRPDRPDLAHQHRVLDRELHGFVVVLVDLLVVVGAAGDEHAADDDEVFGLVGGDHAFGDAISHGLGDGTCSRWR